MDLAGVEPLRYITSVVNELRPDLVADQLDRAQALQNAPDTDAEQQFFRVPKVI
ncbi:MAG: aspartyl/glutamyl-tRNA amidotransferase subunit C [Lewinella sp.]|nr:aspartyl/glutamyl-tRNA amidotransferase subunit C [Lewinella sp.]